LPGKGAAASFRTGCPDNEKPRQSMLVGMNPTSLFYCIMLGGRHPNVNTVMLSSKDTQWYTGEFEMSQSFFDATPPRTHNGSPAGTAAGTPQGHSGRRWLAWYSIPVSVLLTMVISRMAPHDDGAALLIALLAGWACILLSRPDQSALKWIIAVLYPFAMAPVLGILEFVMSPTPMRLW